MPEEVTTAVPVEETPKPEQTYEEFLKGRFPDEDESKDEPSKEESEPAPVEEPSKSEPAPEPGKTEEKEEPAKEARKKGGFQRRIDKLTERNKLLENRLVALESGRQQQPSREEPASVKAELPANKPRIPRIEEFKDLDSYHASMEGYLEARDAWNEQQREKKDREAAAKRERDQLAKGWQVKHQEAALKYEDFDEITQDPRLSVTQNMYEAFQDSELGADVLYYLAKNPKEAARISQLSDRAQIRELGKIEDRLSNQPKEADATPTPETRKPPVSSRTPQPITPLANRAQTAEKPVEDMTFGEWIKTRNRQLQARR